jgi:hypothetical protein
MNISMSIQHCATNCSNKIQESVSQIKKGGTENVFRLIEKVSVVALGVLAALTSLELFLPSFALGVVVGILTPKHQHKHSHHSHKIEATCSHGYIEQGTGIELPRPLALAAGFAVTAVHIDHHASVFVPIVGVTLGIWVGNLTAASFQACGRKISAFTAA